MHLCVVVRNIWICSFTSPNIKVRVIPGHTMKVHMRSRGIAPLSLNLGTRWCVQFHNPAALPPGMNLNTHFIGGWLGPSIDNTVILIGIMHKSKLA
jgi:hypothetical protein